MADTKTPPTQPKAKPEPANETADHKFVILHTLVGTHEQGKVVTGETLGDDANIRRLMDLQAIRPAADHEMAHERVSLVAASAPTTHEARFTESQQQVALKERRITDLENQLGEFQAKRADAVSSQAQAVADATRAKDAEIAALKVQIEQLSKK